MSTPTTRSDDAQPRPTRGLPVGAPVALVEDEPELTAAELEQSHGLEYSRSHPLSAPWPWLPSAPRELPSRWDVRWIVARWLGLWLLIFVPLVWGSGFFLSNLRELRRPLASIAPDGNGLVLGIVVGGILGLTAAIGLCVRDLRRRSVLRDGELVWASSVEPDRGFGVRRHRVVLDAEISPDGRRRTATSSVSHDDRLLGLGGEYGDVVCEIATRSLWNRRDVRVAALALPGTSRMRVLSSKLWRSLRGRAEHTNVVARRIRQWLDRTAVYFIVTAVCVLVFYAASLQENLSPYAVEAHLAAYGTWVLPPTLAWLLLGACFVRWQNPVSRWFSEPPGRAVWRAIDDELTVSVTRGIQSNRPDFGETRLRATSGECIVLDSNHARTTSAPPSADGTPYIRVSGCAPDPSNRDACSRHQMNEVELVGPATLNDLRLATGESAAVGDRDLISVPPYGQGSDPLAGHWTVHLDNADDGGVRYLSDDETGVPGLAPIAPAPLRPRAVAAVLVAIAGAAIAPLLLCVAGLEASAATLGGSFFALAIGATVCARRWWPPRQVRQAVRFESVLPPVLSIEPRDGTTHLAAPTPTQRRLRVTDAVAIRDSEDATLHRLLVADGDDVVCLHQTMGGGVHTSYRHLRTALFRECALIGASLRGLADGAPSILGRAWLLSAAVSDDGAPGSLLDQLGADVAETKPFRIRRRDLELTWDGEALTVVRSLATHRDDKSVAIDKVDRADTDSPADTNNLADRANPTDTNNTTDRGTWAWGEGDIVRLQLSRSLAQRRPPWWLRVLGHDPSHHPRLHLELMGRDGTRLRLACDDAPSEWLAGLPWLAQEGALVSRDDIDRTSRVAVLLGATPARLERSAQSPRR